MRLSISLNMVKHFLNGGQKKTLFSPQESLLRYHGIYAPSCKHP